MSTYDDRQAVLEEETYYKLVEEIYQKRIGYEVTQERLAQLTGISKTYISKIENGKKRAPDRLLQKMNMALELEYFQSPIEILIDYARIRIPSMDLKAVFERLLRIRSEYFIHEDYAFYGYKEQYKIGDITVMTSPEKDKGILIEMKGKGSRQFERILQAQKRSWIDFFKDVINENGIFKRIDIAVNDKFGLLNIPHLIEKCEKGAYRTKFKGYKAYQSGELIARREDKKLEMGKTLYLGSFRSDIYFCIYEKDYEQYVKNGISLADAEVKNRFEVRLGNERAKVALNDLIDHQDIGSTVFGIINQYVQFLDSSKGDKRTWKMNEEWLTFIGQEDRKLKLTMKPEPYTIERTMNWMHNQVAPSLRMALELDWAKGTNLIENMIENTQLKQKQKKIIEQQLLSVEDIIL